MVRQSGGPRDPGRRGLDLALRLWWLSRYNELLRPVEETPSSLDKFIICSKCPNQREANVMQVTITHYSRSAVYQALC